MNYSLRVLDGEEKEGHRQKAKEDLSEGTPG
jgi:hypothetical protein